jgi:hypothetical protein
MYFPYLAGFAVLSVRANCMTIGVEHTSSTVKARAGWTSLGCYTDNVSGRALTYGASVPGGSGAMTNGACQTACLAAGFEIAGTEYAGECCEYLLPSFP